MIEKNKTNNNCLSNYIDKFICGDCESEMKNIPSESIDFVFTSPPYADQIKDYGNKTKRIKTDEYVEWFLPKAKEIYRILKKEGSFVLNISDKLSGAYQDLFVLRLVLALCDEVGFHLVRDYIWYNPATPPNVFSRGTMGRTKKSHEYCYWFCKGDSWTFNMDPIRKPYSKDMNKFLDGRGKGDRNENTRPSRHNFKLDKKWENHGGADPGSVIVLGNTSSNDGFQKLCKKEGIRHPARFPKKLAEFFILSGTNPGDVVLDPFAGSGTTGIVSDYYDRQWICIDINPDYCRLADDWLKMERENRQ